MKTDFESVLKMLQASKAKRIAEGFTSSEFSESIGKSHPQARRILGEMIRAGAAIFVGKRPIQTISGAIMPVPIYKLTPRK